MRQSMTGYAHVQGGADGLGWVWELRGVNGKGLDLRLRLPDSIEGLEAETRKILNASLERGNVQVSLRLALDDSPQGMRLDQAQAVAVLEALTVLETEALDRGLTLAPSKASDLLALRGVLTSEAPQADPAIVKPAVLADLATAVAAFVAMRQAEGAELAQVLARQLDEIADLTDKAAKAAADRAPQQAERLRAQLARVMDNTDADPQRVAQELAVIAVKSDITEELDRLAAHITAGRDLLASTGAVGRKLDFLMQEFNREANTLCSKSGDPALTQIGLALKTVIDQMREQVQNVE